MPFNASRDGNCIFSGCIDIDVDALQTRLSENEEWNNRSCKEVMEVENSFKKTAALNEILNRIDRLLTRARLSPILSIGNAIPPIDRDAVELCERLQRIFLFKYPCPDSPPSISTTAEPLPDEQVDITESDLNKVFQVSCQPLKKVVTVVVVLEPGSMNVRVNDQDVKSQSPGAFALFPATWTRGVVRRPQSMPSTGSPTLLLFFNAIFQVHHSRASM